MFKVRASTLLYASYVITMLLADQGEDGRIADTNNKYRADAVPWYTYTGHDSIA